MTELSFKRDDHVHDWSLIKHLGSGGNSEVWRAKKADDESEDEWAPKILTKQGDRAPDRFVREVDVNTKRPPSALGYRPQAPETIVPLQHGPTMN